MSEEKIMNIEGDFDLNIFEAINYGIGADIPEKPNMIGASDIAMGMRKNLIKKILGITFKGNAKTLFGTMFEEILRNTDVLQSIILLLNAKIELEESMAIDVDKQDFLPIFDDYLLRLTPDIWTSYYTIEVKTTSIYTKEWERTLAPYQANQLNTYLGYYKHQFGFLLKVNSRAFISNINNYQEGYWGKVWEKYGYIIPVKFDPDMYKKTIDRTTEFFHRLETKDIGVKCPEFAWECKYCHPEIREFCGKIKVQCRECKKIMWDWLDVLKEDYIETPVCESCFQKIFPSKKFEKFKYYKTYPWE
jgi:hypothetical protein